MNLIQSQTSNYFSIKEASVFASNFLKKDVSIANISYLVNYGKITKIGENGTTQISKKELIEYYDKLNGQRIENWKEQLGNDLNWALSFDNYKESETTKHVHRLHPYKGKFIPQLVEYFLDTHKDEYKKEVYFKKNDIVLDPFCGSGTTLVQANELGINAIGIDISAFNAFISNCKVTKYETTKLKTEILKISKSLQQFIEKSNVVAFENELLNELNKFNNEYFPIPDFKYKVEQKQINGNVYGAEKEKMFLPIFNKLVEKYQIELLGKTSKTFLDKWFLVQVRKELDFVFEEIKEVEDQKIKRILTLILSRTMRSCRATTHADLATLKEPITTIYYCAKHGKVCKPLFSILKWWNSYCADTLKRLSEFEKLRTNTSQFCITGDSRTIDVFEEIVKRNPEFGKVLKTKKINGIFSSPPYVGLIDYHEQHAYAYDLFGFERNDNLEIGPLFKGQGKAAQESYVQGISDVLNNCKKYLIEDFDIFLVSNDKYNLYPCIAEKAGMQIVNQFKRPVLNRTEKDKGAYSEIIFHLKRK